MLTIVKVAAKSWFKCACCGEQVRSDEKCVQVTRNDSPVRGERYCVGCEAEAAENNPAALFKVVGDNRWFARTEYGVRTGYEHTGMRCEDYPCCGCC